MAMLLAKQNHAIKHILIGREVWFCGAIWRVISAHRGPRQASPWLTLQRAFGVQALAKVDEVTEAFN